MTTTKERIKESLWTYDLFKTRDEDKDQETAYFFWQNGEVTVTLYQGNYNYTETSLKSETFTRRQDETIDEYAERISQ